MKNFTRQTAINFLTAIVFALLAVTINAQTTAFTYQGKLTDGATAASGNYDMQFTLFKVPTGGDPQAATVTKTNVALASGIFTVVLDFGAAALTGADRYLQISVKRTTETSYTDLNPRQQITSSPYSVRTLSATFADDAAKLGGAAADQFVKINDARLTDERDPKPGSVNYIQNSNNGQQSGGFSISGVGRANELDAATQFKLGGNRVVSGERGNFFVGFGAGAVNTTGNFNSFFGTNAGTSNRTGASNTFVRNSAGAVNDAGGGNTFVGTGANQFVAAGDNNTLLGAGANTANGISNSTAIGAGAAVSTNNTMVLGTSATNINVPGTFNASNVNAGTLADARLSANVAKLSSSQIFTGTNTFLNPTSLNRATVSGGLNVSGGVTFGSGNTLQSIYPFRVTLNFPQTVEGLGQHCTSASIYPGISLNNYDVSIFRTDEYRFDRIYVSTFPFGSGGEVLVEACRDVTLGSSPVPAHTATYNIIVFHFPASLAPAMGKPEQIKQAQNQKSKQ